MQCSSYCCWVCVFSPCLLLSPVAVSVVVVPFLRLISLALQKFLLEHLCNSMLVSPIALFNCFAAAIFAKHTNDLMSKPIQWFERIHFWQWLHNAMWWWKHKKHHLSQAQMFRVLIVWFNRSVIKKKINLISDVEYCFPETHTFKIYAKEINFSDCFYFFPLHILLTEPSRFPLDGSKCSFTCIRGIRCEWS